MNGSNFMHGWVALAGSLAMIALILTAFGLMLGIVKPADALRRVAAILGVVMLLMVLPAILVSTWSGMSLWQRLALAAIVLGVCLLKRPRRESRKR
jgi:Zn-dependent protease with chaperone function